MNQRLEDMTEQELVEFCKAARDAALKAQIALRLRFPATWKLYQRGMFDSETVQ